MQNDPEIEAEAKRVMDATFDQMAKMFGGPEGIATAQFVSGAFATGGAIERPALTPAQARNFGDAGTIADSFRPMPGLNLRFGKTRIEPGPGASVVVRNEMVEPLPEMGTRAAARRGLR